MVLLLGTQFAIVKQAEGGNLEGMNELTDLTCARLKFIMHAEVKTFTIIV